LAAGGYGATSLFEDLALDKQAQVCGTAYGITDLRPLWVISGHFAMRERCPLYPQKRTFGTASSMSAMGVALGYDAEPIHLIQLNAHSSEV
jgi:hypothetical protein